MRTLLLFCLALLLSGCTDRAGDNAIFLSDTASSFVDADGTLTLDEARRRKDELFRRGSQADEGIAGAKRATSRLWLVLSLPDAHSLLDAGWSRPFALILKEPRIRHVDAYVVGRNGVIERSWDWRDARRLAGNGYRYPLLGFEPTDLSNATLFLRIATNAPSRGLVWLSDFQSFFGGYNAETTTLSIAIGVMSAILIYILALGSSLQNRTDLWLAASIGFGLVYVLCRSAFLETQLLPGATSLSQTLVRVSSFAIQASLIGFSVNFLAISADRSALARASRLLIGCLLALAVVSSFVTLLSIGPFPVVQVLSSAVTIAFICLLCIAAILRRSWRVVPFVLCALPALVPVLVWSLVDVTPRFRANLAIDDGILIGISLSLVLFTILASYDVRQREKALKQQILKTADRFRGFAEIGTDSFWEVDAKGDLTFLSGKSVDHARLAVGASLLDRLTAVSTAELLRPIRETVAGRLPFNDRRVRLTSGDRDTWISLSGRPILDRSFGPAVYRGVIRDVTEETEREGRRVIEQQMLALGQLVGSVAHEINNLLHPIINLTKRLRNRERENADIESVRLMELIDLSSRQAAKVVAELLQSTRSQRWKDVDRPLALAVEHSVEAVRPALPSSVRLDVVVEEIAEPTVKIGDLLQVVGNLVSNAVHAMNGSGRITVSLAGAADGARLTVSDDGAGMEESVRQRAMQPFFTTKTDGRGTGVGLYVVQRIVRDYDGWIAIDSTPGVGTTFTIFFPFRKDGNGNAIADQNGTRGR